ncbi:hypothetical protein MTX78_19035 [Hymenobacter tibetensis]|uniref:Uncharacterized protein n=1 Tax=Hymenobacter tibetensis TaxID=497967 RepID=A0ABY4CYZ9_9BACT|nr:hypothetical protein [Hymenobacter tibetensis]UOG74204.1 hypothetical protein MTX78_19035 [Hymenobacter tibetensis]
MVVKLLAGTASVWIPVAGAAILIYGLTDYALDLGSLLKTLVAELATLSPYEAGTVRSSCCCLARRRWPKQL